MNADPADANLRRITLTIGCRDAESIPKVPNAGAVEMVNGKPVQIMHNGLKVAYGGYHGDWMGAIIHGLRGHHEPQEEKAFYEILRYCRPKTCILELGAFWAYYSLWYLRSIPFSRAYCVEPDASHMAVGRENMRLNGLEAKFVRGCVGDEHIAEQPFLTESGKSVLMPKHTAASALTHFGLDRVEVLHADIQGAEARPSDVLRPLFAAGKIRFVVISTHHSSISGSVSTHADCLAVLRGNDGHILCEHDVDESYSGDGLIVAAMRPEDRIIPPIPVSRCRRSESLFTTGY